MSVKSFLKALGRLDHTALEKEIPDLITQSLPLGLMGLAAGNLAFTGLDMFNRSRDRVEMNRQMSRQRRQYEEELKRYPQLVTKATNWDVMPEEIPDVIGTFNQRMGHSNTWGGRQY